MTTPRQRNREVPGELSALLASLASEERAKVEALFETAMEATRNRQIIDLWEQADLSSSYWILIVSGINEETELNIAETLLKWKAFFARHSATVLCIQSSEREIVNCCAHAFHPRSYPALIIGDTPEMETYVRIDSSLLLQVATQRSGLHRFFSQVHELLERGIGLVGLSGEMGNAKFWDDFQVNAASARDACYFSEIEKRQYDVFLSHNSKDKKTVRRLAKLLKERGLNVWFDEWQLVPGRPWQDALQDVIQNVRTAAVLVAADGFGPWELPEMRGCLSEFVKRRMPVIPVLLPGAGKEPEMPLFLREFTWVDLRDGLSKEALEKLEWGITGRVPKVSA